MTDIFELVRRYDLQATPVQTLNLLGYADGIQVAGDGYVPALPNGDKPIEEVITLLIRGTSHDNLAVRVQALDDLIEQQRLWKAGATRYGVWLRAKADGENAARLALVLNIERANASTFAQDPIFRREFVIREYQLVIRRTNWEGQSGSLSADGVDLFAGRVNYNTLPGDLHARFERFYITQANAAQFELWAGVRSNKWGSVGNFQPIWDLRLAGIFGDSTTGGTSNPDGTAYANYKAVTTFTGTKMLPRITISLAEAVAANRADNRGQFLVLLRAKVTGSAVCNVQLGQGYRSAQYFAVQGRVRIESTSWRLYPIGYLSIPPSRLTESDIDANLWLNTSALQIQAELLSGTGNLDYDTAILIPIEAGMVHASSIIGGGGSTGNFFVMTREDGSISGFVSLEFLGDPTSPAEALAVEPYKWGLAPPSGTVIICSQRNGVSALSDTANIRATYVARHSTLRGDDGG